MIGNLSQEHEENDSPGSVVSSAGSGLSSVGPAMYKRVKKNITVEDIPELPELRNRVSRALVIDDVGSIRKLLPARLRRLAPDMQIEVAENGQAGLEMILHHGPYDLVISDVVMPVLSGPEMVSRLREHESLTGCARTPVVGMSANTSQDDVDEYLRNGMDSFMFKPMPSDPRDITTTILRVCDPKHLPSFIHFLSLSLCPSILSVWLLLGVWLRGRGRC